MARPKKRVRKTKHKKPSLAERSKPWLVAFAVALGTAAALLDVIVKAKALF